MNEGTDMSITETVPRARRRLGRGLLAAAMALGIVSGTMSATMGTAAAAMACTGARDSNVCLWVNGVGNGQFVVHVGIDFHISREAAQEYIDDAGDPFRVWIRGDDNGPGEFLFSVPMTGLGASDESGLSADFERTVPGSWLNEDAGTDEVYAELTLTDTDTNTVIRVFKSPIIVGNWS